MSKIGKCIIIGSLAGILNGLFGAGGGLVLVPLFTKWLDMEEKHAFASSIAVILPISITSYIQFRMHHDSILIEALPYLVGGAIGGFYAPRVLRKISTKWLHRTFSILILYGAVKAVLWP